MDLALQIYSLAQRAQSVRGAPDRLDRIATSRRPTSCRDVLRRVLCLGVGLCLLGPTAGAFAACTTTQELILPVGNVDKDRACRFKDIQTAIDHATCPGSTIVITPSLSYTAQQLKIKSKQIFLYGAATCSDKQSDAPGAQVTISGAGQTGNSVIAISGSSFVAMQNLFITGGNVGPDKQGGGIYFDGAGVLSMANVAVYANSAGYGAGIYVKGEKSGLQLTIGANTLIENNVAAHDGGGIYSDGSETKVSITGQNTSVYANSATGIYSASGQPNLPLDGYGGGMLVGNGSYLTLSAGGVTGLGGGAALGAVDSNKALRGGGIALVSVDDCLSSVLTGLAPDSTHPLQISANHASYLGGAIYARPHLPPPGGFCPRQFPDSSLDGFRISANTAADGAAIYLDWDTQFGFIDKGSSIYLNWDGQDATLPDNPKFKAPPCSVANCNIIEENVAQDDKGNLTKGSLIFVGISSAFWANRVSMRHNTADNLIYVRGDNDYDAQTRLSNALLVDNKLARSVLTQENDDAPVLIDSSTIAHNTIKGDHALNVHSALTLTDSLIGETVKALDYSGDAANLVVDRVIAANGGGLTLGPRVLEQDPGFIDPSSGNFALADGSAALDFAEASAQPQFDLLGQLRSVDLPTVANRFGPRDLGALERNYNVAAASAGAVASASSTINFMYPASAAIDGDRSSVNGSNFGFWNDNTPMLFPDYLEVDFSAQRTIAKVVVYSLQDDYTHGVDPSDALTFSLYGLRQFEVQALDPATLAWTTVAVVSGNNLVKRTVLLTQPVTTSAIRVLCVASADGLYSRIVEVEAQGG